MLLMIFSQLYFFTQFSLNTFQKFYHSRIFFYLVVMVFIIESDNASKKKRNKYKYGIKFMWRINRKT